MENFTEQKTTLGLYDPQFEHDACGIGAVVDIKGRKSHQTVSYTHLTLPTPPYV